MKKTILVVDDVADNIRVLKELLERSNYTVRVAKNGPQALERSLIEPLPDLILLDVMMDGMDGYEVCTQLKKNPSTKKIPVIFVTARGEEEDETTGFLAGAVDYITKPISPPIVLERVRTHLSLVRMEEIDKLARSSIFMLGEAGHYNDTDTGVHIWRMASYAKAIALSSGWPSEEADMLELAAPLHDTGKIGIPDEILKAPRKLTDEEWQIMRRHSKIGYDILSMSDNPVFKLAADIALSHHEKWDGTGYPEGRKNEETPESARIVAVADVFDALTMKRPYKEPWTIEDAIAEINQSAGKHLDPRLVKLFDDIEPEIREIKEKWDSHE